MMQRILAVTEITIRRLMKSRLLWIGVVGSLLIIGLFMTSVVGMVKMLAAGETVTGTMLLHVLATIITFLGALAQLIAIFVGVSVVKRDVVEGTVASVLSKPVSRGEYIAASYAGAAIYLFMMWALFALVLTIFAAAFKNTLGGAAYMSMLGRYLVCVMTMGIALFFSIRAHPALAVVLTFVVLRGTATIEGIVSVIKALGGRVPDAVVNVLAFPFPVQGALDNLGDRLTQGSLAEQSALLGFLHIIDYGLVMAVLAYLVFRGLEINRVRD
jgi:ABC-type transport system involved in multi-copper enzyme maturation permease subunit